MQTNLARLYRQRSKLDDTLGRSWYADAHRIVLDWANHFSIPIATVACVIAAISPQVDWERNLVIADDVLHDTGISIGGALHSNVAKARRILADRATQITPYFPHGPKVASFACNLAGDSSIVTVDTHCAQAALNNPRATIYLRWLPYSVFAEAYQRAARKARVEPAVFQAIIWHVWRRLYPAASKRHLRREF